MDSAFGLEETPEAYVGNMVAVFREVRRVLRDDGTMWLNLGDSYASGEIGRHDSLQGREIDGKRVTAKAEKRQQARLQSGLKQKDLVGIPWRVAFALQADGWYLRSDLIWHKPNPMPESVTDRPTKAHEYVFLLSKRERYFYDAEAIKERALDFLNGRESRYYTNPKQSNGNFGVKPGAISGSEIREYRNRRTVWTIPTQPYSEAHFATFPEELPKLCILAGSKPGDTVLDPFAGSGTTGKMAIELGRKAVLIELNPAYVNLAQERCNVTPGWY